MIVSVIEGPSRHAAVRKAGYNNGRVVRRAIGRVDLSNLVGNSRDCAAAVGCPLDVVSHRGEVDPVRRSTQQDSKPIRPARARACLGSGLKQDRPVVVIELR